MVVPTEAQWVTMTDPVVYNINSNVEWNIT